MGSIETTLPVMPAAPSATLKNEAVPSSQRVEPGSVSLPVSPWPKTAQDANPDADAVADKIVDTLNQALAKKDAVAVADLFQKDGYWRDHLALSWDLHTAKGRDDILARLQKTSCPLTKVAVDRTSEWRAPKVCSFSSTADVKGIQFYTTIETEVGSGRGVVRLIQTDGRWGIWTFFTGLTSIRGHEEPLGARRAKGVQHGANPGRKNWLDRRVNDANFENSDPDVLIIGAGQGGLTAHARLKMLDVPALIIDKNDEIGDNWRKRYHQLVLHDPVWYDHLPYINFPDYWPVFTPKDKLAEWFQSYAKALELNVWTRTTLESARWDAADGRWRVEVRRGLPDGTTQTRVLRPRHIVQATGHSGKEHFPEIPGRDSFRGDLLTHSSRFPGAREQKPGTNKKKAIVIGACNSSHDICQDYYEKGYDVTMVQRSSTCVVSSEAVNRVLLGGLYEEGGPPVEDADLWLWGWPTEVFKALQRDATVKQLAYDSELLAGLERSGFRLDRGPEDCGLFVKYFQRGGGYYFDVGASRLISEGKIRVRSGQEVAEILPGGIRLADGSELEADEIVFATGYENMRSQARIIFGDEVADRLGDIWGYGPDGELRALWQRSGHPGFWYHGGNLALCRYYSRVLALQIKAQLLGLSE